MNQFLAEIMPQSGGVWDSVQMTGTNVLAGLVFLLILCVGIALDFALVLYCLKRPQRPAEWEPQLSAKALPGHLVATIAIVFVVLYFGVSVGYALLFKSAEIAPHTLFFQTFAFHIPALVLLGILLTVNKLPIREHLGLTQKKTFRLLGLSALLYLAAIPLIWFYSLLYQMLLNHFGYSFYLQDVSQIFFAPMSGPVRAAVFFIAIIAAPAFEEIIFRGVLLPWMVRRTGLWPGMVIVSLLFAGMHLHLPSFFPLFLLSCIFCAAYARTGSIWVPIGMHALFNGVSVSLLTLMGDSSIF